MILENSVNISSLSTLILHLPVHLLLLRPHRKPPETSPIFQVTLFTIKLSGRKWTLPITSLYPGFTYHTRQLYSAYILLKNPLSSEFQLILLGSKSNRSDTHPSANFLSNTRISQFLYLYLQPQLHRFLLQPFQILMIIYHPHSQSTVG